MTDERAPEAALDPLAGVSRTALWTLHCRAAFAGRGEIHDPMALTLAAKLGPRMKGLGWPDPSFARRAQLFDRWVRAFLERHPGASVVALGEGLETQRHRVQGYGRWVSVDLPEIMAWRDALLPPGPNHEHRAESALDLAWLPHVETPSFVVAQGLFMYLEPSDIRRLLKAWAAAAAPGSQLAFDVVPPWVTWISRFRVPLTPSFRLPKMPFGARRRELEQWAKDILGNEGRWEIAPCPLPSGPIALRGLTSALLLER
ncbi:MAG: class I SAM-dependent methyltransferase [Myxococcota bacterium]